MNYLVALTSILLVINLSSCSIFAPSMQSRDKQYLNATITPPLKIPPGINSEQFQQKYPLSNRAYSLQEKQVSLLPPGL